MEYCCIDDLDIDTMINGFLQKNLYNKDYFISSGSKENDYTTIVINKLCKYFYSIQPQYLKLSLRNDTFSNCYNSEKIILFLQDSQSCFYFYSDVSYDKYLYKEYEDMQFYLNPISKKIVFMNNMNKISGIGKYENENKDKHDLLRLEIEKLPNRTDNIECYIYCSKLEYNQNIVINTATTVIERIQYNKMPYLLNTLLYENILYSDIQVNPNKSYLIKDFDKEKAKHEMNDFEYNFFNNTNSQKYIHIRHLEKYYPDKDCDWIFENIKDVGFKLENSQECVSHVLYYIKYIAIMMKEFYQLPKLLEFDSFHIDVVSDVKNKPNNLYLFFILIKITNGTTRIQFKDINYILEKGSVLFYTKKQYIEYVLNTDDNNYFIFVQIQSYLKNTKAIPGDPLPPVCAVPS